MIIVDGYNLLFSLFQGEDLQDDREQLIAFLAPLAKKAKLSLTIVFDSTYSKEPQERSHIKDLEIHFTAYQKTADEEIIDMVEREPSPEKITVVTSDKGLAAHVKDLGAHHVFCPLFLHWLKKRGGGKTKPSSPLERIKSKTYVKPDAPPPPGSDEWYEKQFGEDSIKKPHERPLASQEELDRWEKIFNKKLDSDPHQKKKQD